MLVYGTTLSLDDCEKVEAYLRAKWFENNEPNGVNGRAYARRIRAFCNHTNSGDPGAVRFEAAVPAGETLEIAELRGGRGKSSTGLPTAPAMVKTGGGSLELDEAEAYGGTVELRGGTLRFTNFAVPSGIPDKCDFHFDASAPGALTTVDEAGGKYVTFWRNESAATSKYKGESIVGARAESAAQRPLLVENAFGPGKHALDFGPQTNVVADGRSMRVVTNETAEISSLPVLSYPGVVTYIAVMSAERGGGETIDVQNLRRGAAPAPSYVQAIAPATKLTSGSETYSSAPQVYVNGAKWSNTVGFPTVGFQVISVQACSSGTDFKYIAQSSDHKRAGGYRLAELLVYRRILSDREIKNAHAYLMQKWFGRAAPGYERTGVDASLPAVQSVYVEEPSEIRVDRGSLRIRTLSLRANLVKSGDGELCVENLTNFYGKITVKGGSMRRVEPYDPATCSELAPSPALHVDASDAATIYTDNVRGTNFVIAISSRDGRNSVLQTEPSERPWLSPDLTLNGLPIVDFGRYGKSTDGCKHMKMARPLDAPKSKASTRFGISTPSRGGFFTHPRNYSYSFTIISAIFRQVKIKRPG